VTFEADPNKPPAMATQATYQSSKTNHSNLVASISWFVDSCVLVGAENLIFFRRGWRDDKNVDGDIATSKDVSVSFDFLPLFHL
jgi:hypothetical protein